MSAIKPSPDVKVTQISDRNIFLSLKDEWNDLVLKTNNEPFYRHEIISNWIDNFAADDKLRILTARNSTGRLVAALPLIYTHTSFYGLPMRQLSSPTNSHSCRFDMLAESPTLASSAFFSYLMIDRDWDLLKIIDVPDDGNAWGIYFAAQTAGFPVGNWESQRSPYLLLPNTYEKLMKKFSSQFNATIRSRYRRLERLGKVTIDFITGSNQLNQYLEECFAIEQSGWKGQQGTAINQHANTYHYYTKLAQLLEQDDALLLALMRINGTPIAFQFGILYNHTFYGPKNGYSELYKNCSPGLLLLNEVIKYCIAHKTHRFDFLGNNDAWKTKWTDTLRSHKWLFIYANSAFGQILQKTKFNLIPVAKQMLKDLRGL